MEQEEIIIENTSELQQKGTPESCTNSNEMNETLPQIDRNDLIDTMLHDARMCRFVADVIAGDPIDQVAQRIFPTSTKPPKIDSDYIASQLSELNVEHELLGDVEQQLSMLIDSSSLSSLTPEMLNTLCRGVLYDIQIAEAEQKAYIKGRNEQIEIIKRDAEILFSETPPQPQRARYTTLLDSPRRSIWD